jgi:hypothetical protein
MHTTPRIALTALALAAAFGAPSAAQTPAAQELPKSQVPTLGRPTKADDPAPMLDFMAYFKGSWNVTWDYPESPLGPADVLTGTTTYSQTGPSTFEALTEASNAAGALTIKEVFEYAKDAGTLSRTVTDSRGFSFAQEGSVAGDLGGQFTIRLDGAPFTVKGRAVRMNSVMRLLSPYNYRTQSNISVDDGPFTNFGNPWWRKDRSSR